MSPIERHGPIEEIAPNVTVETELREIIEKEGLLTFAEFMDVCLYSPEGYYASGRADIGRDFDTAPEAHPGFGRTIGNAAHILLEATRHSEQDAYNFLEMGAGNGTLARGVLHKLQRSYPDLFERCHYMIAERGPGQVAKQQQVLAGLPRVTWFEGSAADIPAEDVDFAFSNELLDVAPLHRLVMHAGVLRESYVGMDRHGAFIAVEDEISQAARDEIGELDIESIPDDVEITVSPMQTRWLQHMAEILRPGGNLMTIDYATKPLAEDPMSYVPRVYASFLRPASGHPAQLAYRYPGTMDITASVDFGRLIRQGKGLGLQTIYHDTQAQFLRANDFENERDQVMNEESRANGRLNAAAHYLVSYTLLDAQHMGGHRVLVQERQKFK